MCIPSWLTHFAVNRAISSVKWGFYFFEFRTVYYRFSFYEGIEFVVQGFVDGLYLFIWFRASSDKYRFLFLIFACCCYYLLGVSNANYLLPVLVDPFLFQLVSNRVY